MLRFLADENFNNNIVRGLLRRKPDLDIVRAQDVGLDATDDSVILEWAARAGRILLTHDVTTITHFAYERIRNAQRMAGVFEVNPEASMGRIIEDILLLGECSLEGEWENQVWYLPL